MQLICISRGSYGYGKDVAERLADKMGYVCISREQMTDMATDSGIPVGKLEVEVLKNRPLSEEMAIQMSLFKAFVGAHLCGRALEEDGIVYHGRTGHLVLQGISQVLRVRAIADMDSRIQMAMRRMNMGREKVKTYIEEVDDDIRRWIRTLYNENWEDPSLYDITINAAHLSVENAATALLELPKLPEFQATPASMQAVRDLLLASCCRLAIGKDDRTRKVKVTVHAEKGNVSVTYLPRQAREAAAVPEILEAVEGVESLICTVATTNILYIAERFDPEEESLDHLIEISEKWNAAIELINISGDGDEPVHQAGEAPAREDPVMAQYNGGILEDDGLATEDAWAGHGVPETMHKLIQAGCAGGYRTISGDPGKMVGSLSKNENNSLVVIGDIFTSKGGAQQRMKRDLVSLLSEKFRIPVIGTEELKSKYLFGPKQLYDLIRFAVMSIAIYFLVFKFQDPILTFISTGHFSGGTSAKIGAALAVTCFIPIIALSVGGFYRNLLKLIKLE